MQISKKVILVGQVSVGKTSLVNQYVYSKFNEQYLSTIGVRINKKLLNLGETEMNMIIWDLAGEASQHNTPQSYFLGASGAIYVVDLSNPQSFSGTFADITYLKEKIPGIPVLLAANKSDLLSPEKLSAVVNEMTLKPDFITSAKNNSNVNEMFVELAQLMLN